MSGSKRGDHQNCSVFVLCAEVVHSHKHTQEAVLTVLWIWFCQTGPTVRRIIYVYVFVFRAFFIPNVWHIIVTRSDGPGGIEAQFFKFYLHSVL